MANYVDRDAPLKKHMIYKKTELMKLRIRFRLANQILSGIETF